MSPRTYASTFAAGLSACPMSPPTWSVRSAMTESYAARITAFLVAKW